MRKHDAPNEGGYCRRRSRCGRRCWDAASLDGITIANGGVNKGNGGVNEETRRRSGGRDSRRRERLSGGARAMAACTASAKYPPPVMDEGAVGTPLHSTDTTIANGGVNEGNGGVNEETRRRSGGRDSRRRERLSGGARAMAACLRCLRQVSAAGHERGGTTLPLSADAYL